MADNNGTTATNNNNNNPVDIEALERKWSNQVDHNHLVSETMTKMLEGMANLVDRVEALEEWKKKVANNNNDSTMS